MAYTLPAWTDSPSTATPLNATNLALGNTAIGDLDSRVTAVETLKAPLANPAFTGTLALPGGASGDLRLPVNGNITIDGSTLPAGTSDKVGFANSVVFQGGFSAEAGYGGANPGFLWGANDFVIAEDISGSVAGIGDICARETEVHLYTPAATLNNLKGLQVNCKVEATATGSTVTSMFGVYVSALEAGPATVTNNYGVYIEAPVGATNNHALFVVGSATMIGPLALNGGASVSGNFTQGGGEAFFTGGASNAQGTPAGVAVGSLGGNSGINIADGTNTWGIDLSSGTLRFMKAGVQQNAALDLNGNFQVRGGVGFYNTAPTTQQTVTGAKGSNAALASLLTALAAYGLITDSSTT